MRVVGGRLKRRILTVPEGSDVRPTSDLARESLFNILEHRDGRPLADARVLDVFEGEPELDWATLFDGRSLLLSPHVAGYSLEAKLRATSNMSRVVSNTISAPAVGTSSNPSRRSNSCAARVSPDGPPTCTACGRRPPS